MSSKLERCPLKDLCSYCWKKMDQERTNEGKQCSGTQFCVKCHANTTLSTHTTWNWDSEPLLRFLQFKTTLQMTSVPDWARLQPLRTSSGDFLLGDAKCYWSPAHCHFRPSSLDSLSAQPMSIIEICFPNPLEQQYWRNLLSNKDTEFIMTTPDKPGQAILTGLHLEQGHNLNKQVYHGALISRASLLRKRAHRTDVKWAQG